MTADQGRNAELVAFPGPDEPYLFVAGLRKQVGSEALTRALVVPTDDGPAVLLDATYFDRPEVVRLLRMLDAHVTDRTVGPV